jgi:hypothetical protein
MLCEVGALGLSIPNLHRGLSAGEMKKNLPRVEQDTPVYDFEGSLIYIQGSGALPGHIVPI